MVAVVASLLMFAAGEKLPLLHMGIPTPAPMSPKRARGRNPTAHGRFAMRPGDSRMSALFQSEPFFMYPTKLGWFRSSRKKGTVPTNVSLIHRGLQARPA
jgi:hypothetical protein